MLRAAVTSVLLSALFVLVYGGTNWLTARRPAADVCTWYFPAELSLVPYVPALVVPYMSIDLLFFAAPFLCGNRRELRALTRRVVFAILVAAAFFLLLPLRLAWPARPHVGGWFGDLVEQSLTAPFLMEYPHNLFPALHVTLSVILGSVYARHTRGAVRALCIAWFGLIILSTVLTWQHHLVDVAGGFLLAAFAFYLFPESAPRLPVTVNFRVGSYYASGAVAAAAVALAARPLGAFLLWPAAAFGMLAAGYFGLGPGVFRKVAGRLPLSTRVALAPVLVGQYLSLAYYRRRCRAWDEVAPGVLVGRTLTAREAASAVRRGVTAVLDLTAEFSESAPFRAMKYHNLPVLDLTAPTRVQLHEAVAFIARGAAAGRVYVHCKIGFSRSAAVVGAYLLATRQAATAEEAVARLCTVRPGIVVRPEAMQALRDFARGQQEAATVSRARTLLPGSSARPSPV